MKFYYSHFGFLYQHVLITSNMFSKSLLIILFSTLFNILLCILVDYKKSGDIFHQKPITVSRLHLSTVTVLCIIPWEATRTKFFVTSFGHLFDNFWMASVLTGQSKCENWGRQSSQAPCWCRLLSTPPFRETCILIGQLQRKPSEH